MKNLVYILISIMILCSSCGNNQKASPRPVVYTTPNMEYSISDNKIYVPYKKTMNDLIEVQVSLNGVPFNMFWDTGASMTCISSLELNKLIKEGRIRSTEDFLGSTISTLADGSTTNDKVYRINEVFIQGNNGEYLRLKNIETIVSNNAEAPLLIGQNVISNLPKHSFNEKEMLIEFEK